MGGKTAGSSSTRLPSFCLNRIRPHVRVRSPQLHPHQKQSIPVTARKFSPGADDHNSDQDEKISGVAAATTTKGASAGRRKIMIVVDSSGESKVALQWALSQTIQSQDYVILLHVAKPSNNQGFTKGKATRGYELVNNLKKMCQAKRPEVEIEAAIVEGKEKGPVIVEEAKKQGAALLVLGQRKRSMTWRLIMMWASNKVNTAAVGSGGGGVVDYCIQNAECMAIAVRRKSNKHGGYLITTKRHKDFWLLA
ncbi:unnamed protein product [Linum trigynum]|uniref:UspA domain-containing protein n=1 Tax=Linum trigynum TaxID=586398 RepID=A0AAV2FA88_9ROSI